MSTEVFEAKSRAKIVELVEQSRAIIAGKIRGLHQENQSVSQKGASKVNTTRKLSVMLNYVLDLSGYAGMSNVPSNHV